MHLTLDQLAKKIPSLDREEISRLEMILIKTLKFQLLYRHPFNALYGLFLDLRVHDDFCLHWIVVVYIFVLLRVFRNSKLKTFQPFLKNLLNFLKPFI